jgi:hypothetical protein
MGSILSAVVLLFAFRFRSRASLEIELMADRATKAEAGRAAVAVR